ncbi:MAG: DUF1080 domain-containing protein [Bacteroidia bacterium]|nr:DUF1080 domain-containing protein [Bacteroidia bacterium]
MKFNLPAVIFIAFVFATGCKDMTERVTGDHFDADRPHNPWVFRSVLDSQARMVILALHDDLWAAYNTDDCTLYKAWKGHVHFDGAVYTTVHGPQPTTIGDSYMEPEDQKWQLREAGILKPVVIEYKGHRFSGNSVTLNYEILDDEGNTITISETPDYYITEDGSIGMHRLFETSDVPEGKEVVLKTTIGSVVLESSIQTNGSFEATSTTELKIDNVQGITVDGQLVLNSNQNTELKTTFVKTPLIPNSNKKLDEEESIPEGARLIARSDCKTCHNTFKKTIGPAYVEVAKKYRNTKENRVMLASKIRNGGSGVWGPAVMTAHPGIEESDLSSMVTYIMELDADTEAEEEAIMTAEIDPGLDYVVGKESSFENELLPGLRVKYFKSSSTLTKMADMDFESDALVEIILPDISLLDSDLSDAGDNFGFLFEGYIKIPIDNNYVFRLISDDGSILYLNDQVVIDFDGLHGAEARDGELALKEGFHQLRLEFFQSMGGKSIQLQWRSFSDNMFKTIPPNYFWHHKEDQAPVFREGGLKMTNSIKIPGDGFSLDEVHPSFTVQQARPDDFLPKVGGIDFLSDGRMIVSTWDPAGTVYMITGHESGNPEEIYVQTIAKGLAEPLGLKVVDDEIYVLQKQELTKLIDHDGDELIDEYQVVSNDWLTSGNFHEFAFGLEYKDGYFYATLATAIQPGGASTNPQIEDRGKVAKISKVRGTVEFIAEGLRTPNGIGFGVDGELFVADNQGDWLPASKIVHVKEGAWYGSRSVDFEGTASRDETLPVVWLPQDEIGNSPSTPTYINKGIYNGQMIHGEVTHGGIKRVFVEKINDQYQGCVFRFTQGLEAGINRLRWSPDGALYAGGIGSTGNWGHSGKLWYGLQKLEFNNKPTFEMLAVRSKSNGLEIEFTEPLREGDGWDSEDYEVLQWRYEPTENYGGPKLDEVELVVISANVSEDRRSVFLEIEGIKAKYHVVYLKIENHFISENNHDLWSTEAWYTMNQIPVDNPGETKERPQPIKDNSLSAHELDAGWKLLFDGQTSKGWHNFNKNTIGTGWKVIDGALTLDAFKKDGQWQPKDGGDIISDEEFENFELSLEWKIAPCGNSGIMFNVVESEDYDYPWLTGPEMQVLDNVCHPDAKIPTHRAGDLFDMISCKYETVKPAGEWNHARIVIDNGTLQHWLNGRKVVETEMFTPQWEEMITNSKFKDMPAFGKSRRGKISLQDHGDRVAFKNIKIREITTK